MLKTASTGVPGAREAGQGLGGDDRAGGDADDRLQHDLDRAEIDATPMGPLVRVMREAVRAEPVAAQAPGLTGQIQSDLTPILAIGHIRSQFRGIVATASICHHYSERSITVDTTMVTVGNAACEFAMA